MILPSPLVGYAAAGALVIGLAAGYTVRGWQCDAAAVRVLKRAAAQRQEMQDEVDGRSAEYEAQRYTANGVQRTTETEIKTIYRTAPSVPASCGPTSRVVELLKSSVDSANANATGKPSE